MMTESPLCIHVPIMPLLCSVPCTSWVTNQSIPHDLCMNGSMACKSGIHTQFPWCLHLVGLPIEMKLVPSLDSIF